MMIIPTEEEMKLCDILDSVEATKEEKKKAQDRLLIIGKEKMKNNPFHQD
ncbi:unknown [Clostridium sp. CAG:964]|nr:unknown [Clostridium sp. CAG:964]